jgi:tetratricopeptide (TPR) repeat protein
MADIFVSYTSSDSEWAHWLGVELKALGHNPFVHEWEISAGDDIYAWMEQRHDQADHVLCVVSDAYLKAPFSTLERNAALWQAAKRRSGFVLMIVVEPCKLPNLADHLRRCEVFGVPEDEARQRLKDFLAKRESPDVALFPGQARALSNIPIRVPEHFLGRDDALAAVDAALKRYQGRVAITAVHGLRGVGKTTLAAAYAERHKSEYRATWWVRAQTPEAMRADLVALGVRLGWVAPDEKEAPAFERVAEQLRHEGEGLLLIYDNAIDGDALRPFLPKGGGARVLVTSNAHAWRGLAEPIELKLWPKQIGADYFVARLGREAERADAEALSEALGGLPLAHEQAAAYCERLGVELADYARRFAAQPIKLLDAAKDAPAEYHDRLTVAKTFALAIEEAAKLHRAAEPLIIHAALLAPEPIPLFLFADGRAALGEPLASALAEDGLEEALAALRAFALVDLETIKDERDAAIETKCLRLHRLVRMVAAGRYEGEAARSGLVGAMAVTMEACGSAQDARSWPSLRRLDGLAGALIEPIATEAEINTRICIICNKAAMYRQHALGDYARARPLHERALAIREKTLGLEHPETATGLNNLGHLLQVQGDRAGARPLYDRALAICEKALGPEHPKTAVSLNNLALLLHDQGNLAGARPLCERALAIREKALGPEHPDTATSLNNLAYLLKTEGDLAGAQPLYERALAIREKGLGPEHPDTALSLNNLASLLQSKGDRAGARPLIERALAVHEKVLGPEHPETARSLNNLAYVFQEQGDLSGARPHFERALAIREKTLGPEHPATATILNNLAYVLQTLGDLAGARPLYERALAIREKVLGTEHPDTAVSLSNLGTLLLTRGDLAAARVLFERALTTDEKTLGAVHPNTAMRASNLAGALVGLGDFATAEPLYRRAIAICEAALGAEHLTTRRIQSRFALLLIRTARPAEGLPLAQAALAVHTRVNGPNHPWTKDAARAVAEALEALGRADEAAAVRREHGV